MGEDGVINNFFRFYRSTLRYSSTPVLQTEREHKFTFHGAIKSTESNSYSVLNS
jgi:hypothetical protein